MKILWVCNVKPNIENGAVRANSGGWIDGTLELLKKYDAEICVAYPGVGTTRIKYHLTEDIGTICFPSPRRQGYTLDPNTVHMFKDIIDQFEPDILHIWGTEMVHSKAAFIAFNKPEKTIVTVQGLPDRIADIYYSDLPIKVRFGFTLHDLLARDNVSIQRYKYYMRGKLSRSLLENAKNITGRTDWDYSWTRIESKDSRYYHLNEVLRDVFYNKEKWSLEKCEPHRIYISQGSYSIKGLQYLFKALNYVCRRFPDTMVNIGGIDPTRKQRFGKSLYGRYLLELIDRCGITKNIHFIGPQNAEEVKNQLLASRVFILPSSIENSSNSLGEAMITGVPVISSLVGGVRTFIRHNINGYLYPHYDYALLAHDIINLFTNDTICKRFSKEEITYAELLYSREQCYKDITKMYEEVMNRF